MHDSKHYFYKQDLLLQSAYIKKIDFSAVVLV